MTINNNDKQKGGSPSQVSDIFSGLVVPAYAYYHNGGSKTKNSSYKNHNSDNDESDSEDEVIDDDLHDKLLGLVREHDNKLKQEERTLAQALETAYGKGTIDLEKGEFTPFVEELQAAE
jgi:hypothetical protein